MAKLGMEDIRLSKQAAFAVTVNLNARFASYTHA
jgi:hypothetical protein